MNAQHRNRALTTAPRLAAAAAVLMLSTGVAAAAPAVSVDLELVIAVDISPSMDAEEQAIQRAGYVEAIRHPDFIQAVASGVYQRIAVTYVEWAGSGWQKTVIPWRLIDSAATARAFADQLSAEPISSFYGTSISAALTYGADLFADNGFDGGRRTIDISGDGPNNSGGPVVAPAMRNRQRDRHQRAAGDDPSVSIFPARTAITRIASSAGRAPSSCRCATSRSSKRRSGANSTSRSPPDASPPY